jgi:hypothetical protein
VPVGEFSIFPEITEEGVKLGSVKIGKTDPLRRFIIGLAPVILGLGLLLGGVYYVSSLHLLSDPLVLIALSYLVFQVSNTMFSSKEDMKGALELVITLVLLLSLLLIGGVRIPFEFLSSLKNLLPLFSTISKLLLIPLVVNILVILLIRPIKRN